MADYTGEEIIKAVLELVPGAILTISNNDIDNIEWKSEDKTEPSKVDIEAKIAEQKTAYDNLAYARARDVAYPSVKDFMEAYTEKEIGGDSTKWDTYVVAYNKVRTDNPKP
jgi:predicted nucleotidyltransferase|tara:strand:+ start:480 stop:812 length:333 start_codon:yes stop_codon:yes gene_type:complete